MFKEMREMETTAKKMLQELRETLLTIFVFFCWPRVAAVT